jgi:hypothetical protein
MSPIEFRQQFLSHIASNEGLVGFPELRETLAEFVAFDRALLLDNRVPTDAVDFLCASGLPRQAAPYLAFEAYSAAKLADLYDLCDMPRTLYPLGANGSGDPLGIELSSGAVVFLNHDNDLRRVFINSSVGQFAACLCLCQEYFTQRDSEHFMAMVQQLDPQAVAEGAMWRIEAVSPS